MRVTVKLALPQCYYPSAAGFVWFGFLGHSPFSPTIYTATCRAFFEANLLFPGDHSEILWKFALHPLLGAQIEDLGLVRCIWPTAYFTILVLILIDGIILEKIAHSFMYMSLYYEALLSLVLLMYRPGCTYWRNGCSLFVKLCRWGGGLILSSCYAPSHP